MGRPVLLRKNPIVGYPAHRYLPVPVTDTGNQSHETKGGHIYIYQPVPKGAAEKVDI